MVQLSQPYMTTGKTIALTIGTFVGKVLSLFLNTQFRSVIAFLPRSKHLLILWLQSWFPGGSVVKNLSANARDMRLGFEPWVSEIPWSRKWQPAPAFLPGESHGQRSLVGYTVLGPTKSQTQLSTHCIFNTFLPTYTLRMYVCMYLSIIYIYYTIMH